jgi:tetratricopeptide (TPR) repeat protein
MRSFFILAVVLIAFAESLPGSGHCQNGARQTIGETETHNAAGTSSNEERDAPIKQAREFLKNGLLNEADHRAREFLTQHPDSADAHFLLAYILFREHKPERSLAEYTEGAKYIEPEASDLKIVALNYVLLDDYSDADKWLTRSVEKDSKDPESWYYLGRTKYKENRFEEAVEAFEQCLKLDSKNVKAETNLGLSLAALGRTSEAQSAYRNAIAQQEGDAQKNSETFIDFGNLLLDENQPEDAIKYLSKAREIAPQEFRVFQSLGKAYLRLNKLPEAQTALEKAVSLTPDDGAAHYMLGQVYQKQGLTAQAKLEFDRAMVLYAAKKGPPPQNDR